MFENLKQKIALGLAPELRVNAKTIDPTSAEFPYDSTAYDYRLDAEKLLQVLESGSVDRILMQIFMFVLNGRDIKIITPEDQESEALANKSNEVRKMLWRLDKLYDTETLMAQTGLDCMGFGSGLVEMGVNDRPDGSYTFPKTEMGWNAPAWLQYTDAYSLAEQPAATMNTQAFVPGRVLKGIAYDIEHKQMQYWQTQAEGFAPVQLPTARMLHIRDKKSRYPDGKSYLAGIAPTVLQLEFVRKAFMQSVNYKGVGRAIVKVKELRGTDGQPLPAPVSTTKTRWQWAWNLGVDFAKNYGNNNIGVLSDDHELIFPNFGNIGDITKPDEYLKAEILAHLIPRDFVEQTKQSISASSTPLLELLLMVVRGWRTIIATPFSDLYTDILQANGFTDWACEFTFKDPSFADKSQIRQLAVQVYMNGGLTEDRLYEIMEWPPISKEERKIIDDKKKEQGALF